MAKTQYYGTGRRKSSVARVRLIPGSGNITVNKKTLDEYLPEEIVKREVKDLLKSPDAKENSTLSQLFTAVDIPAGGGCVVRTYPKSSLRGGDREAYRPKPPQPRYTPQERKKRKKKKHAPPGVALRSSASAKLYQKWSKTPELRGFRGFSFSNGLTQFDRTKPLLTRFLWVKWWTTTPKKRAYGLKNRTTETRFWDAKGMFIYTSPRDLFVKTVCLNLT